MEMADEAYQEYLYEHSMDGKEITDMLNYYCKALLIEEADCKNRKESLEYWRNKCYELSVENDNLKTQLFVEIDNINREFCSIEGFEKCMEEDCQKLFGVSYEEAKKKHSKGVWNELLNTGL